MKVEIGGYVDWFGPYQLAEKLMFWVPKEKDEFGFPRTADRVHNFGEWLAHGSIEPEAKVGEVTSWNRNRHHTWIYKLLSWIHSKKKRKMKIQIDKWDTWSMDHTLAHIILPMLKQLKATQHGSPFVDDEDLPEHLRMTDYRDDYSGQKDLFDHIGVCPVSEVPSLTEMRWDWVLDEMINAFEKYVDHSWEDKYRSGEHDIQWVKLENGMSQMQHGPNDTYKCDYEGMQKEQDRINNGLRLFGKYYRGLWD